MRVLLDDLPLLLPPGAATLEGALDAARAAASSRGRIITEVWADGEALSGDALGALDRSALEVRLTSESPLDLVRATLLDAAEALEDVREAQRLAADLINAGEPDKAAARLSDAIHAWEDIRTALDSGGRLLGRDLAAEPEIEALIADLTTRLGSIQALLRVSDWAALADELAFDMDEHASRWRAGLIGLSGMLR